MRELEINDLPNIKPKVKIDTITKLILLTQINEESQVIVHCCYTGKTRNDKINIWKSTFLYAKDTNHRSTLVYAENISMYPEWMFVDRGQKIKFTLIFTGLPKQCKVFDFIEDIPEPEGFVVKNIVRNNSDVYILDIE